MFLAYFNEFLVLTLHSMYFYFYLQKRVRFCRSFVGCPFHVFPTRLQEMVELLLLTHKRGRLCRCYSWFLAPVMCIFGFDALRFHSAQHLLGISTKQVPELFLGGKTAEA